MPEPSVPKVKVFLATPLYDGRVHHSYMMGTIQMALEFPGELIVGKVGSSYRPQNHDRLTQMFMQSNATHLLFVNSDIIWTPADAQELLAVDREFVTGIYGKRRPEGLPVTPERRDGDLIELEYTGAGFLLLKRSCVERLEAAHPELIYETPTGPAHALWSPRFEGRVYAEDRTFCSYWRALGGKIWAHTRVILKRHGESVHLTDGFTQQPGS
ncbi:MAG: hypothetical protein WDO69_31780 [Pseudomonadota bacterium]